ncbi:MAG: 50S ribosomal protein L11 methyltransferase [Bacteroidetes bacterium]|nr:50S ribosomal protein L11 methyltransferase [Bacteroidota bacterium]
MSRMTDLKTELASHFPLREIEVAVGDRSYRLTTAEDIELLIERITDEEFRKDERLPYWAELWHSAVALAEAIEGNPSLVTDQRVLEIGCGLALPAVVAASHGARVTCGDFEPLALEAAELNLLQNAAFESADVRLMDFRNPPRERWPLILAADVIYEKRFIEPLADFLDHALEPDGTVLLAEPNRLIAVPFFDALTARGFSYTRTSRYASLYNRNVEISVYRITR